MSRKKSKGYTVLPLRRLTDKHLAALTALQTCLYSTPATLKRRDVARLIRSKSAEIFVAIDRNGIIVAKGTATLSQVEEGCVGWYHNIVVDKHHRRHGLMSRIHRKILAYFRKAHVDNICVSTHRLRKGARAFYKKIGFVESGTSVLVMPMPAR